MQLGEKAASELSCGSGLRVLLLELGKLTLCNL